MRAPRILCTAARGHPKTSQQKKKQPESHFEIELKRASAHRSSPPRFQIGSYWGAVLGSRPCIGRVPALGHACDLGRNHIGRQGVKFRVMASSESALPIYRGRICGPTCDAEQHRIAASEGLVAGPSEAQGVGL